MPTNSADRIHDALFDDGEARVGKDIPASACREVPANFLRVGATQTLTKVAGELASAKTILPWLLTAVGASPAWVAWLVPVRESMSMLPQLLIASVVRRRAIRKAVWVAGALLQGLALLGMAARAVLARGSLVGALMLGLALPGFLGVGLGRGLPEVE